MKVLIINSETVRNTLTLPNSLPVLEEAFRTVSLGATNLGERKVLEMTGVPGKLGLMPGYLHGRDYFGVKVVSVFPKNPDNGLDAHQGMITLFDAKSGQVRAIIEASSVTQLRTAFTSAMATRLLSRVDSKILGLIGTGPQSLEHTKAISQVRKLERVLIYGRNREKAQQRSQQIQEITGLPVEVKSSADEVSLQSDIVCTLTSSTEVLVSDVKPGTHVNAIGASRPGQREVSPSVLSSSRLFLDYRPACFGESQEIMDLKILEPARNYFEIGEVLSEQIAGRESDREVTVFKSVGIAVQDVAMAEHLYALLRERDCPYAQF